MTVLVLDLGSSSVRALLFDDDANLLTHTSRRQHFTTTPPGASTLDPASLQWDVEACIDELLANSLARDIRAVGMDTFVGNVLGVDAKGQAVTPIYGYADTRSAADVAALSRQVDLDSVHQRTGCLLHTAYLPARLRWLRRTEPTAFAGVAQWIDIGTFLYRRWFGDAPESYSVASWSGLLNRAALEWDSQWLDVLDISPTALPPLDDASAVRSGLLPQYAARWSALRGVPFFLAVGDGAAANVGSNCAERGRMALSLGTTAALRVVSTEKLPPVPNGLWSYRITADLHLIGGATTEGGSIFEWVSKTISLPPAAEQQLLTRAPDGHGLTFLPLLAGERSPGWVAEATGTVHGLRLSTTPLDILQAALEGVALRLAIIAGQLDASQSVIASGRALELSPAWAQMIADALNLPLRLAGETEITARGTAILVLSTLDKCPLSSYPLKIAREVEPRPAAVEVLRAARERQQRLYRKLYR